MQEEREVPRKGELKERKREGEEGKLKNVKEERQERRKEGNEEQSLNSSPFSAGCVTWDTLLNLSEAQSPIIPRMGVITVADKRFSDGMRWYSQSSTQCVYEALNTWHSCCEEGDGGCDGDGNAQRGRGRGRGRGGIKSRLI